MRRQTRAFGFLPYPFWKYYNVRPSRMVVESMYTIKKEYSGMDFVPIENELKFHTEKGRTAAQRLYIYLSFKKWGTLFFIGFAIGCLGALHSIVVEEIFIVKNNYLSYFLNDTQSYPHIFWVLITAIPVLIAAFMVVYIEPTAMGSGIPAIIAYLNGVNIPRFGNARVAAVKYVATILTSTGNMPGGREEPFIHFGALFGASLASLRIPFTTYKPFSIYSDPNGRRDLVTAGTAAAVAVAFGSPIGAILFCLEEGITYWNPGLTFLMFVCTVISSFTLHFFRNLYRNKNLIGATYTTYVFFRKVDHIDLTYKLSEVPMFILYGIVGAALGILWCQLHIVLFTFRKRFVQKNYLKLVEAVFFGLLVVTICIALFHSFSSKCTPLFTNEDNSTKTKSMRYYCKGEEFESIGLFIFQDLRYIMTSFFLINKEGSVDYIVMLYGSLYYLVLSLIQSGTHLPSGILTPNFISGGAWGYLLACLMLDPQEIGGEKGRAKYILLGAIAQASGVARLTLGLGIIMVESCGQTNFAIPIFIVVLTAKWFGGIFTEPIYGILANLLGYPLIRASLIPANVSFMAGNIMSSPVISIPMAIDSSEVVEFLRTHDHCYFPITSNKKVIGVISRRQIFAMLKTKTFQSPEDEEKMKEHFFLLSGYESESFSDLKKEIRSGKFKAESGTLNFQNYMNRTPYIVHENANLRRLYSLFLALGPAYVIVVNDSGEITGIITRKDIARYRRLTQFLVIRTEIARII